MTHEAVGEYLASLRARLCGSTYNGRVCILREIFRALAARAGLEDDPWRGVRLRPDDSQSRRELTVAELRRLLSAAWAHDLADARKRTEADGGAATARHGWRTLFLVGIYTGLRLGDCCTLDWSSIDLERGIVQLVPAKTKRHAHGRPVTIPVHPALRSALSANDGTPPPAVGPVMPELAALYRASRHRVCDRLAAIFKSAGIATSVRVEGRANRVPVATFHSLRHTFVSMAANAGVPLHVVQSIVGHGSTAMTRHYWHESVDALRRAVEAIPAFCVGE